MYNGVLYLEGDSVGNHKDEQLPWNIGFLPIGSPDSWVPFDRVQSQLASACSADVEFDNPLRNMRFMNQCGG